MATKKVQAVKVDSELFTTKIKALNISQPDVSTCQSACIGMATGDTNIMKIRNELIMLGEPGDPYVMGSYLRKKKANYQFNDNACLNDVREWLKAGEFLITHGWFTRSGHVICLDGLSVDIKTLSYKISVKDPWSEFDAKTWSYPNKALTFYDGYYSSYCIYASCVKSSSSTSAASIYRKGELNSALQGMWVHRIKPQKEEVLA